MWDFKETLTESEKEGAGPKIQAALVPLKGKIEGVLDVQICFQPLSSSNADLLLEVTLETAEQLQAYYIHPEHILAGQTVKALTQNKRVIDYRIEL
jgi:hypothetical protein